MRIKALAGGFDGHFMGHPVVDNRTSLAFAQLFLLNEEGRSVFVALTQATYDIVPERGLVLSAKQEPPSLEGELWGRDVATSSYRIEPTFAFFKPASDVVLVGHAVSGRRHVTELEVLFRVGTVGKVLRVVGDRTWVKSGGAIAATRPLPFDSMPLTYEHAFGGWDKSHEDPHRRAFEPRNPVGVGFRAHDSPFQEGLRLPNVEDPKDPLHHYGQVVNPAGVGFVSPHWQPRASYAGTYDETWQKERMPLLPKDFDRRFFQGASPGLVAPGYLHGDETVFVENASPHGRLSFRLPGLPPPRCRVERALTEDAELEMRLDTIVVDTDRDRVFLLHRGHVALRDGPHDVRTIALSNEARGL